MIPISNDQEKTLNSMCGGAQGANLGTTIKTLQEASNTHAKLVATQTFIGSNKFGSDTNYVEIATDGHMSFAGTGRYWDDHNLDALSIQVTGTGITKNVNEQCADFSTQSDMNDFLYANVQMLHGKDLASAIYPHIHFWQNTNAVPNFLFQYRWQINGDTKTAPWINVKCNTLVYPYVSGTLNQIAYSLPVAPLAGTKISDILQFRVIRDNANASGLFSGVDPINAGVGIICFDVDVLMNSIGGYEEDVT
jgi:hypothetical protein